MHRDVDCLSRAPVDDDTDIYLDSRVSVAIAQSRTVRGIVPSLSSQEGRAARGGRYHSFHAIAPFELVTFDVLDPLPASLSGHKHVIVSIHCFTRYVVAAAVEDTQASTFARFLSSFISRFGVPSVILTEIVRTMASRFKFEHRKATAHHHEGNAMVERVIQTLQEKVSLIMSQRRKRKFQM